MTEAEWLESADPMPMLEFLRGKTSDRKLRLFAVACCRRIWQLLTDERSRKAVELAEQSADHHVPPDTLDAVSGEAEEAFEDAITPDESSTAESREKTAAACVAASYASNSPVVRHSDAIEVMQAAADASFDSATERAAQAALVRELWEYPFRPIALNPVWLTPTVKQLAVTVYDDRAFDRLPILADALEDAGCDQADILSHCCSLGPHVRGCWVVDLALGKE